MHHGLDRKMQEDWIQFCEDEGLPEPSSPPIAVGEWMDELELVMEYTTPNKKVVFGIAQPIKEIGDEMRNLSSGGGDMYDLLPREDADATSSKISRPVHQGRHHCAVRLHLILSPWKIF